MNRQQETTSEDKKEQGARLRNGRDHGAESAAAVGRIESGLERQKVIKVIIPIAVQVTARDARSTVSERIRVASCSRKSAILAG